MNGKQTVERQSQTYTTELETHNQVVEATQSAKGDTQFNRPRIFTKKRKAKQAATIEIENRKRRSRNDNENGRTFEHARGRT